MNADVTWVVASLAGLAVYTLVAVGVVAAVSDRRRSREAAEFSPVLERERVWRREWECRNVQTGRVWHNPPYAARHRRVKAAPAAAPVEASAPEPAPPPVVTAAAVDRDVWEYIKVTDAVLRREVRAVANSQDTSQFAALGLAGVAS